jgi:hypothetical protein
LDRRLGGPQSQSGCDGEEQNFQPQLGIEPQSSSLLPIAILTELPQLYLSTIEEKENIYYNLSKI